VGTEHRATHGADAPARLLEDAGMALGPMAAPLGGFSFLFHNVILFRYVEMNCLGRPSSAFCGSPENGGADEVPSRFEPRTTLAAGARGAGHRIAAGRGRSTRSGGMMASTQHTSPSAVRKEP
jgi:hypothetical protein